MDHFPGGADWVHFLAAVQAFMHGQNPYLVGEAYSKVYEPFWTYIFLIPFAVLPFWLGRVLLFIVSFAALALTAVKMGANRFQLILFLTSSTVLGSLYDGNMDWLVTLGLWMPPQLGLFFVLMKPQMGITIAAYWLYIAWKEGGLRKELVTLPSQLVIYSPSFSTVSGYFSYAACQTIHSISVRFHILYPSDYYCCIKPSGIVTSNYLHSRARSWRPITPITISRSLYWHY